MAALSEQLQSFVSKKLGAFAVIVGSILQLEIDPYAKGAMLVGALAAYTLPQAYVDRAKLAVDAARKGLDSNAE